MKQQFVKDEGNGCYSFYCPGCETIHVYYVHNKYMPTNSQWSFNMDLHNPTFTPSLLNRWGKEADPNWEEPESEPDHGIYGAPKGGWSGRCHLFVTNGMIHYCGDCTHEYNGKQNVPMIEYDPENQKFLK